MIATPRMMMFDHDDATSDSGMSVDSFSPFSSRDTISSCTTMSEMGRSGSPTPSVYSVTSSLREQAYRDEFGRSLNNYSEVYRLPADMDELERLDHQHNMFKHVMGKYPEPIYDVLREEPMSDPKAILDLGCGSGSWIIEAARDFPHCSAVGVDLVPMPDIANIPDNMRSEVDDVNLGLDHFYGDFNVVHARLIASGVRDYPGLIDQMSRVLRPGGLLILLETDFLAADEHGHAQHPATNVMQSPWLARFMMFVHLAIKQRGGNIAAADHMHEWVAAHPAFEEVVSSDYFLGASPWHPGRDAEAHRNRFIAMHMRVDLLEFLKSARPLLLGSGMPLALYEDLARHSKQEMMESKVPASIRCKYVYARKKHNVPIPPHA